MSKEINAVAPQNTIQNHEYRKWFNGIFPFSIAYGSIAMNNTAYGGP
jgi:hypothetical protein